MNISIEGLREKFNNIFESGDDIRVFFAPGRVNLIGEYTDFNGGYVFPVAIDIGTYILIAKRSDDLVNFYSMNFEEEGKIEKCIDIKKIDNHNRDWTLYPMGVIHSLYEMENITLPHGFDVLVYGNIPNGASLSSSASLSVAFSYAFSQMYNLNIDKVKLALIAQKAEHYAGTLCGIMDQFISVMGKVDHGVLLNCDTLEYKYAPIKLENYSLIIMNSNKKRALNESKYNERRAECDKGLLSLKKELNVDYLAHVTESEFEKYSYLIEDDIALKRSRHVITENRRVLKAYNLLSNGEIKEFGKLLDASHISLKNDFEVSCKELDILTDAAREFDGVLGSRMTGAGFGGCAIALVPSDKEKEFANYVGDFYTKETGIAPEFIKAVISDGVREIN